VTEIVNARGLGAVPDQDVTPARTLGETLGETWSRFQRNRLAVIGLVLLACVFVLAALAPIVAPGGPFAMTGQRLQAPTAVHLLGTDNLGRDIFTGVMYGAQTSLLAGFLSTLLAVVIGVVVGAASGFYGGRVDDLLMRTTEIFQVVPRFFLALIIAAFFGPSLWGIIFIIGVLSWPDIARLLRAEFLTFRERPFVVAARAYGASDLELIAVEIMPNALPPVIVAGALQVASAVLLEASLSFLGIGDPNLMSWGTMLNNAQQYLQKAWWTATFPGLAICIMTLGVALIADGLNDALNPRLKEAG
jgi:peptide/nickel transport system permease protein